MIYKDLLLEQAQDVNQLLGKYIAFHNKYLQTTGTFRSLFKSIDYPALFKEIEHIKNEFEMKYTELIDIKEEYYGNLADISMDFFDALLEYFNALYEAVKQLDLMVFRAYETSKGFINNKKKMSWSEYTQMNNAYKVKVQNYYALGEKLNSAYKELESEPNDYIDDEAS